MYKFNFGAMQSKKTSFRRIIVIQKVINYFKQHPTLAKFALAVAAITAALGPLLMVLGSLMTGVGSLIRIIPLLGAAFTALTGPVGIAVAAIAAAIAIGVALYKNWDTVKAKAISAWNAIKNAITKVTSAIKTKVLSNFNTLKSTVTSVFNSIKSVASSAWNGIKTAITSPITAAKNTIKTILNKIKGFFPLSLGKIFSNLKIPHIKISGGKAPFGIGGLGTKPSISVSWYKKAMGNPYLFSNATLFGAGEAGDEMLYGRNALLNDIASATGGSEVVARLTAIEAILDYYLPKGQQIVMDNGALIGQVNRGLGLRL